jgi:hypothetical protein
MARFGFLTAGSPADPKCCSFVFIDSSRKGVIGVAPVGFAPQYLAKFVAPVGEDEPTDYGHELDLELVFIPAIDFQHFDGQPPPVQPAQFNDIGAWPDMEAVETSVQDYQRDQELGAIAEEPREEHLADHGRDTADFASVISGGDITGHVMPPIVPVVLAGAAPLTAPPAGRGQGSYEAGWLAGWEAAVSHALHTWSRMKSGPSLYPWQKVEDNEEWSTKKSGKKVKGKGTGKGKGKGKGKRGLRTHGKKGNLRHRESLL